MVRREEANLWLLGYRRIEAETLSHTAFTLLSLLLIDVVIVVVVAQIQKNRGIEAKSNSFLNFFT